MRLIIDVGNSSTKVAIFRDKEMIYSERLESISSEFLIKLSENYDLEAAILSAVGEVKGEIFNFLSEKFGEKYIYFDSETKISVNNLYKTPKTLGADRLAAAEGAQELFGPDMTALIVDFGSAITIDLLDRGSFLGGNISCGAALRFKALNNFTNKLPLCDLDADYNLIGSTTEEAIVGGVVNSIIFEIEGYMLKMEESYENFITIFTGGDANYFVNKFKNAIFAYPDLVLIGLNGVLERCLIDNEKVNSERCR